MKISRGVSDIKTIIPFMNKVFHKNFPRLLPKLYTNNDYKDNHYTVHIDDKLVGAIASIPNVLHIGEMSLRAYGVGMVSCHKKYRGKGIMSNMLKTIISDAIEEGADFMYLDGNRQRYEYYGFVPAGYRHTFTLTTPNFQHMKNDITYQFVPLREDSPYLDDVASIYNSKFAHYDRKDFLKTLHSWNIKNVYAVLNTDNKVVGHIAYKWLRIVDFATSEPQNTAYIVKAFAKQHTKFFGKIDLYPCQLEEIKAVEKFAQSSETTESTQFKILNYRHVTEVLLHLMSHEKILPDFNINIVIENVDSFNVKSQDNKVIVSDRDETAKTVTFKENEASYMLFNPSMAPYNNLPFTLPLYSMTCDNV